MYGSWYWLGGQEGGTTHTVQGKDGGGIQSIRGHHDNNTGQLVWQQVFTWDYDLFNFGDPDAHKNIRYKKNTYYNGHRTNTRLAYLGGEDDGVATRIDFHWEPINEEGEEEEEEEEDDSDE